MEQKTDEPNKNPFKRLKDWIYKPKEHNPLKDVREMANAFEEDLRKRLEIVVGENDAKHVRFQVHSGYIEKNKTSQLSVKVFMAPDQMQYPQGAALQIHNALWGTENDKRFKGRFTARNIIDTIELFRTTFGKVKTKDKAGDLTTQKKYIFK